MGDEGVIRNGSGCPRHRTGATGAGARREAKTGIGACGAATARLGSRGAGRKARRWAVAELEGEGWRVLHDVHWPGRPKANLDHVLIGPGGVVVLDTKNWTGAVELRGGELRQNGHRAGRIDTVLDQASAVAALVDPEHRRLVSGWICLIGQPDVAGRSNSGVRIEGADTLIPALRALPTVVDIVAIEVLAQQLRESLAGDRSPGLWTTRELEEAGGGASRTLQRRRAGVSGAGAAGRPTARTGSAPARRGQRSARKRTGLAGAVIKHSPSW